MSRILLISSNTTTAPLPVYPLGMALVAASLVENGHAVKQLDLLLTLDNLLFSVTAAILEFNPDFIGISIRNIDTVDSLSPGNPWYLSDIKHLVDHIKKIYQNPIILGGPGFSILPEQILEFLNADFGIVGEGEISINKLIDNLSNNIKTEKILYPIETPIDKNGFFRPLYEKKLVAYYFDQSGMLSYQTKRGCPHGCKYCSYPLIEGRKLRYQTPEFVADNLIRLKKDFNVDALFFTDAIFNDRQGHYLMIAEQLIKKQCHIKWAAYFRPENIKQPELKLLKDSGLYAMEVGSDAACDITLKGINKSFSFEDIFRFNESCIKADIPCAHFFMFGGPEETPATVLQGLKNIERLVNCAVFVFSGIRILPKTKLHEIAVKEKIISCNNNLLKSCYYISPHVDKNWMEIKIKEAFHRKKDRFFPPEQGQMRMRALKVFGFKGLLWDMAIHPQKPKKK
ncbi:MAG: cobalamin-dependent protein [Proteobacteria bacterium]|nr:cobalamin-dependent protein [Pseudomonadota bacterium]MBU1581699.1 cobalamin-dependent protein [Pseudomonadota bacterium]MBU2453561.1 cobalamin-dependent protein [Pseudomonadota bacterium]MBU2631719.1 cobalamin-dependent protein [Pseudomonadota bacterium]